MQSFYGEGKSEAAVSETNDLFMPVNEWESGWHHTSWWQGSCYDARTDATPKDANLYHRGNQSAWWSSSLNDWQKSQSDSQATWGSKSYNQRPLERPQAVTHSFYGSAFGERVWSPSYTSKTAECTTEVKCESISWRSENIANQTISVHSDCDLQNEWSCSHSLKAMCEEIDVSTATSAEPPLLQELQLGARPLVHSASLTENIGNSPELKLNCSSSETMRLEVRSENSFDDSSTDGSCSVTSCRMLDRGGIRRHERLATRQSFSRGTNMLEGLHNSFGPNNRRSKSRHRSLSRKRNYSLSPHELSQCSRCWHVADLGGASDDGMRWLCQNCLEKISLENNDLRCLSCNMVIDGLDISVSYHNVCRNCANADVDAVGRASLNTNEASQCYPCRSLAVVSGIGGQSFRVNIVGLRASNEFDEHISWASLQPVDKPVVTSSMAAVKLRFHCIDVNSLASEWHSVRSNRWEIHLDSSTPPQQTCRWRTGHFEVNLNVANAGSCFVQRAHPSCCGPQLLELGPHMQICLEHRKDPVAAFHGGCFTTLSDSPVGKPCPAAVDSWPTSESYVEAWRRLNFMEAATNGVAENDTKILGGVGVKWTLEDRCTGTFYISTELKDAHKLSIRPDDLVCVRWQASPRRSVTTQALGRDALIIAIFEGLDLDRDMYLNESEMRAFAEFTEFDGDADAWHDEFLSLCQELVCDSSRGINASTFSRLVNDTSDKGCFCSDEELHKFAITACNGKAAHDCSGVSSGPTWVAHALISSVEKFEEDTQVQFQLHPSEVQRITPILMQTRSFSDCVVELIPLPESYHCAKAAMDDFPRSLPLVRDLILNGKVSKRGHNDLSNKEATGIEGIQDLVHFRFNESQDEAVRTALSEPVTLIHGPPGTGKTRTAAAVALMFARRNAQASSKGCVLYAASGNRAVDVAADAISELCIERLEDLFEAHSAEDTVCSICWEQGCNVITFCGHVFHRRCLTQALKAANRTCPMCRSALKSLDGIRLLRIYSNDTERLEFPVPRKYDYKGVRERSRKAVPDEMRHFALHCRIHNKVPGHFNPHAEECANAYEALLAEGPASDGFDAANARYKEISGKARAFELRSCNVLLTTNCSCRRSWLLQMLQQEHIELRQVIIDEAGTSPEPDALCPLTMTRHADHIVLVGDHRQLRPVVKNSDAEVLGLGCSLFERLSAKAERLAEASSGRTQIDESAQQIVHASPIGNRTNLISVAFRHLDVKDSGSLDCDKLRPFANFTGFDEGDDAWQSEYLKVCGELNCDPCVGLDLNAFRNLVDDKSDQGCFCTDSELQELARLSPEVDRNSLVHGASSIVEMHPPASVMLRQQYRMNPAINKFPSQQFYGGQVGNDISTVQRPEGCLVNSRTLKRSAVMLWESPKSYVEEVQEIASREASVRSKANPLEAERCAQLAAALAQRVGAKSVAVLSWYNAQVVELRQRLQSKPGCESVHCGSVVTAQGSEWDYVLLSTVRNTSSSDQLPRGRNAMSVLGCLADRHLLNVAVTRGRLGIVVFGSLRMLSLCKHWAAFVSHCHEVGGLLGSDDQPNLLDPCVVPAGTIGTAEYSRSPQQGARRDTAIVTFQ